MARAERTADLDQLPTPPGKPMLYAPDSEKVQFLLNRMWPLEKIADKVGLTFYQVEAIKKRLLGQILSDVMHQPEDVQAEHAMILNGIARAALDQFHDAPVDNRRSKYLEIARTAIADVREIFPLNAPSRSISLNVNAEVNSPDALPLVDIDDPESRRLLLAFEDRQRQLRAEREADVAGPVRRRGERRALAGQAAPPPDERGGAEGGGGPDQEAVDVHPPAGREVGVLEQVFPCLVSRELPGSAGDLG